MTPVSTWNPADELTRPVQRGEFEQLAEAFWRGEQARAILRNQHRDIIEPPFVTSLPRKVEAHDGMVVRYRPWMGTIWTFVYDSSVTDDYRWVFAGGHPAMISRGATDSTASLFPNFVTLSGPTFTVPLTGYWSASATVGSLCSVVAVPCASIFFNGANTSVVAGTTHQNQCAIAGSLSFNGGSTLDARLITASQVIDIRYCTTAGTATFYDRQLFVTPYRLLAP